MATWLKPVLIGMVVGPFVARVIPPTHPRTSSTLEVKPMSKDSVGGRELSVGQVADRSGVAVSALHFYESEGLITSRRTEGNQRRYPREVLRRVAFIRASQEVGIPLRRIKAALDQLPQNRTPTRRDWERLSTAWRSDLDDRIDDSNTSETASPAASAVDACPCSSANWSTPTTSLAVRVLARGNL